MKKITGKIEDIFEYIKNINGNSPDITTRIIKVKNKRVGYIFLQSVSSDDKISDFLVKSLNFDNKFDLNNLFSSLFNNLQNSIANSNMKVIQTYEDLFYYLVSGFTIVVVDNESRVICLETKANLDRGVTEASTETVVRGPKDGFTENNMTNIGLIRKRIKDSNLWFDEVQVGTRTKTKVEIVYLKDVVKDESINKIKQRLNNINIDGIIDSGYLKDYLVDNKNYLFPKIQSTERPDIACSSILEGKIVILVENSPFILMLPTTFVDFFHAAEDNYELPFNVSVSRMLRFLSFIITIITPAVYIAIMTYDIKLIPSQLLISLASQRQGVPFPTVIEVLLLLTTFEILRESDLRSPTQMGASVSIVGALVLGDAAVSAGIVSPIAVIIVAVTSISGLVFSDIDMVNSIRTWRIIFLLFATMLGLIGISVAGIILVTRLASMETLGTPYLAPLSPFNLKAQKYGLLKSARGKTLERPRFLHTKNIKRGENNEQN